MLKQHVKHYYQWLHSSIHHKTEIKQSSSDSLGIQGPSKRSRSGHLYPVSRPTRVFSFVGYECHLDSALVKPTSEMWLKLQDLILPLKSKHVLTARCLMSLIGLLASTEKMVQEDCLHMRPFQFHLKEHWRYPQSLASLLPWSETITAHLEWWQNPTNVMKGADFHPKDQSIQIFTDTSNGSLRASLYKESVVRQGNRTAHKCFRVEGSISGPGKVQ